MSLRVAGADRILRDGILPEGLGMVFDPTLDGTIKGSVGYAFSAIAEYDSNTRLDSSNEEDDVILNLNPSIGYTSDPEGDARNVVTAYYSPGFRSYLGDWDKNRLNHTGGISLETSGARATVKAFYNMEQSSGADRISGDYSENTTQSAGIFGSYQLAPRTSIQTSVTGASSEYSTGESGADIYRTQVGLKWAASELLSVGPSLSYNREESERTGVEKAFGASLNADYVVTERINLRAEIGVESVDNSRSDDGDDVGITGGASLSYKINELWSTGAFIDLVRIPSTTLENYVVDDLSFGLSLSRRLLYGKLGADVIYSITDYTQVGPTTAPREDGEVLELMLSYTRPVFSERINFSTALSYSTSDWGDDWSRWVFTTGLRIEF